MIYLLCFSYIDSEFYPRDIEIVGAFSEFEKAEEFFRTHEYRGEKNAEFYIETRRVDVVDGYLMISTLVK